MLLQGQVAVVTGASRGIGFATAMEFARHGAKVILLGRSQEDVQAKANEIQEALSCDPVMAFECDVTKPDSVKAAFQRIFRAYGRLDSLVANAGQLHDALLGMITPQMLQETFAVNAFGVAYCCQYAARLMGRNNRGSIIAVSSIIGVEGNSGQTVYGGSKAAVIGMVKSMAKELAPQGIRVNAVAPGFIDTDMARSIPADIFKERLSSIAMNRIGSPKDVADVCVFLASDMSTYVTGQVVGVDGGMLI